MPTPAAKPSGSAGAGTRGNTHPELRYRALGYIPIEEAGEVFLGRSVTQHKQVSDVTAHVIDEEIRQFIDDMPGHVDTYEGLLTGNVIWQKRIQGVGMISAEDAIDLGVTGPSLRGSGVDWDLRRDQPYSGYENYDFEVAVGQGCDTWARYHARLKEMRESCKIVRQALDKLKPGPILADAPKVCLPPKQDVTYYLKSQSLIRLSDSIHYNKPRKKAEAKFSSAFNFAIIPRSTRRVN